MDFLREILVCPHCKKRFLKEYYCKHCKKEYKIKEGIPIFLYKDENN